MGNSTSWTTQTVNSTDWDIDSGDPSAGIILLESSDYLLLENGDKLLLE